jgi:hypothetical protein
MSKSNSVTIGPSELARELGISRERVYQLNRSGKIARISPGKFDLDAVRAALKQNLDSRRPAPSRGEQRKPAGPVTVPSPEGGLNLASVQLQHEIAKATKAQLEVKRLKGILVDAVEVKRELSEMISAARSRALIMPAKLAAVLASETDVRACHAIIEKEIRSFLTTLSEYEPLQREPAA